jgi:hypothetical protein
MAEISFAMILNEHLNKAPLKLKQCETNIEITDPVDPTTLQLLREDPSVKSCFTARRDNLNKLIVDAENKLATLKKAGKPKAEAEAVLKTFNAEFEKQKTLFQNTLTEKVKAFCTNNAQKLADHKISQLKFVVRNAWSIGELLWGVGETVAGGAAAIPTGGASLALAGKGLLDFILKIQQVYKELKTAQNSATQQAALITKALTDIKSNKDKLTKSHITAAESALAPYGPKILSVENQAKELSADLEELLAKTEKAKIGAKKREKLEKLIDRLINTIITLNSEVTKARAFQQSAKDKIKNAVQGASKPAWDSKSFVAWVLSCYDKVNDMFERNTIDSMLGYLTQLAKDAVAEDDGD